MVQSTDFPVSLSTNPYYCCHYNLISFALKVNGKQIPNEGLSLNIDQEKIFVMAYWTLFEA